MGRCQGRVDGVENNQNHLTEIGEHPAAAFEIVALAALSCVLGRLPADFPAPVTIVQHLHRRHRSLMAEILGKRTPLEVRQAREGHELRPGWVYIAPPDHHLLVNGDGTLSLAHSELVHFVRPSADLLFESMAAGYGQRSIVVVLTGSGSDGEMGVKAVKELETSNEELQSANAELQAMNDELRQRTVALNRSNAFLDSILSSVDVGVVAIDRNFQITLWNDRAEDLWGLRAKEVEGLSLLKLNIGLPVEELKEPVEPFLAGQAGDENVVLEAFNRRGQAINCYVTRTIRRDPGGEPEGIVLLTEEEQA
jgi:two-component system chemotaxis response regulator CheB